MHVQKTHEVPTLANLLAYCFGDSNGDNNLPHNPISFNQISTLGKPINWFNCLDQFDITRTI